MQCMKSFETLKHFFVKKISSRINAQWQGYFLADAYFILQFTPPILRSSFYRFPVPNTHIPVPKSTLKRRKSWNCRIVSHHFDKTTKLNSHLFEIRYKYFEKPFFSDRDKINRKKERPLEQKIA